MSEHRYILEPYKGMNTRHICPDCKEKSFTFYIDTETGEHLNSDVGRCDHESKCGYHKRPPLETRCLFVPFIELIEHSEKAYKLKCETGIFYLPKSQVYEVIVNGCYVSEYILSIENTIPPPHVPTDCKYFSEAGAIGCITHKDISKPLPISFIPVGIFKASLRSNEPNHFVMFLKALFGVEVTNELICKYFIGTSKHWNGSTAFWQIDITGKVRTGKIIQYSPLTGKRVKIPFGHVTWVHSVLKTPDFQLKQCMFGEHLLQDRTKPIAIVESEKTAIIASVYLPQFIWLASGGLSNLNADKCSILKGRNVTLFPDCKGFDKWSAKAKELAHITTFNVSDLLERKASEAERQRGDDLADYLIKFDYKAFAAHMPAEPIQREPVHLAAIHPPIELYQPKPLQCATGRLRGLEDSFISSTQGKGKPANRQQLVKMFDRYKRTAPTIKELNELTLLMGLN